MDLITEYRDHLIRLDRSERTVSDYINILQRMDNELPAGLASACTDELHDWIFIPGRSASTRNLYRATVAGFCAWATDPTDPRLDYNAAAALPRVKPKRTPRPILKTEQLGDILARAAEPWRTWFTVAAYAGLRSCEIAGLNREHVTDRHVWVRRGKGGKERLVPTHPRVWAAMQSLPSGPVALDRDRTTRLTAVQVVHRGNRQLRTVLGYPGISMHRLRAWFGTSAYRATKDLRAVQELLGHASPATTQLYVDVDAEQKAAAVLGLPEA
jgi:integrase/recombinase XerC